MKMERWDGERLPNAQYRMVTNLRSSCGHGSASAAPAVTLVEVSRLYGPDSMIEIEAVAAV